MTTDDKSQMPLFSPEDEKEAQKELKRLRKNENKVFKGNHKRIGFEDKTLWDWLNLIGVLAIPLVVVGATIGFGWWQVQLADHQHQSDQNLAKQQHEADLQQALDQQRQATFVTYQDNMKDLLLNRGLLTSKPGDEIRVIARTETLSAMRQLDGKRNSFLIQFLQDAHLIGFHSDNIVSFVDADLSSTDLSGANLSYAIFNRANLSGANLSGANLIGTIFNNANLSAANLSAANLSGANLSAAILGDAILSRADLSAAILGDAILSRADLSAADLNGANLNRADLSDAILGDAILSDAIFNRANLSAANLSGANLIGTIFNHANLSAAILSGANLNPADLSDADLNGANLSAANLSDANFSGTTLNGADLSATTLTAANNLTQQQLDQVYSCKNAILPTGLTCNQIPTSPNQ